MVIEFNKMKRFCKVEKKECIFILDDRNDWVCTTCFYKEAGNDK